MSIQTVAILLASKGIKQKFIRQLLTDGNKWII